MDANFRLKNQLVSTYSADPGLGTGMAYMVDRLPYESYVLSWASDADVCIYYDLCPPAMFDSPNRLVLV